MAPREFNVLALVKGDEHYVYIYDEASRPAVLDAFRNHATNPHLSLTWFDASVLSEKLQEQAPSAQENHSVGRSRL